MTEFLGRKYKDRDAKVAAWVGRGAQ